MCSRTSKNKGQSGRRLNTLVAFFEISFKILERFWDFFCQKLKKRTIFGALVAFLSTKIHVILCIDDSWNEMMMFSYWIPEVRFWIAQNYSRISILLWPNRNKNPAIFDKITENDWTMQTYGSLIFGLGRISQAMFNHFWS